MSTQARHSLITCMTVSSPIADPQSEHVTARRSPIMQPRLSKRLCWTYHRFSNDLPISTVLSAAISAALPSHRLDSIQTIGWDFGFSLYISLSLGGQHLGVDSIRSSTRCRSLYYHVLTRQRSHSKPNTGGKTTAIPVENETQQRIDTR